MKNFGKVEYSNPEVPPGYKCTCGATGCKLWRAYQTFLSHQELLCAPCAAKAEDTDVSTMDSKGLRDGRHSGRTDQIGSYIPAVPTNEGDTFWGYLSVPQAGCEWWENLPSVPQKSRYDLMKEEA